MSDKSKQDWTRPAAMAIPKGGFVEGETEQGRYGPIFPKSPACCAFTIIAKIIPEPEEVLFAATGIDTVFENLRLRTSFSDMLDQMQMQ